MFSPNFPTGVSFSLVDKGDFDFSSLCKEERELVANASEKRKIEFTLGRIAARRSASELGHAFDSPLLRGTRGEPLWPSGLIGAITHTRDIAASATSINPQIQAIGLDLEYLDREVASKVASRICIGSEIPWVKEHSTELGTKRILQLFSAKEAFYKAVNPLIGIPIRYADVELCWKEKDASFEGTLLRDLSPEFLSGFRFTIQVEEQKGVLLSYLLLQR